MIWKRAGFKLLKFFLISVTLVNISVLFIKSFNIRNNLMQPVSKEPENSEYKSDDSNFMNLNFDKLLKNIKFNNEVSSDNEEDLFDWHDYKFMYYEKSRTGPGENGSALSLTDPKEIAENKKGYDVEGFYTVVSDKISPNRSVPDIRLNVCKSRKYLKKLPSTSVIVIFVDEPWSLLLRCLHSIYNRTPHELLQEIILFNDKSRNETLGRLIEKYSAENFGDKVRYFENTERKGLIVTRMEGARRARGEVIVFLDSHMEVNVNWLPPLIDPIARDSKIAVVPIIDSFSPFTLEYQSLGHGARGSFDWTLTYQWLKLTKEYQKNPGDNYQLSAMTGGAYAINREYFFYLGGYDEGMMVWNGENYELSFKVHLCGGNMIQVPCSHVAHTTKHRTPYRQEKYGVDYSSRNLKRLAEVWMDEYKEALYQTDRKKYDNIDPGDLTKAFELKRRLNCRPFKYFVDVVAPDLSERFPPFELDHFANGSISTEDKSLCVTYGGEKPEKPLTLKKCSGSPTNPEDHQKFALTWHRFIQYKGVKDPKLCVDAAAANMYGCHYDFGNQYWKYDLVTHQIMNPPKNLCLTTNVSAGILVIKKCDPNDFAQKFLWGLTNDKALENWETEGRKLRKPKQ